MQHISAETNVTFPDCDPSCMAKDSDSQIVPIDICQVAFVTHTSSQSSSSSMAPEQLDKGGSGNGSAGVDGYISYDMAYTASLGFASFDSNNEHNGTSGMSFFHNHESVIDFAYRVLHRSAVLGK